MEIHSIRLVMHINADHGYLEEMQMQLERNDETKIQQDENNCVTLRCYDAIAYSRMSTSRRLHSIPERVHQGDHNQFVGNTYCTESCGAIGCGCGWFSSGCMFYRIYALPTSSEEVEVFQCLDYQPTAQLQITSTPRTTLPNLFHSALSISAPINTFIDLTTALIYNSPRIASKYQGLINPRRLQFSQHGSQVLPFANEHQTSEYDENTIFKKA
uniref:Phlebovirus_G2 domain-containing protein n=1 Tax=Caenorhabditis japonica TaxID=281687 RepID=A0A8R1IM16_CAEJA